MRVRDGALAVCAIAAIGAAIFALGGALRWSQALVAGLVALALVTQLTSRRVLERRSPLVVVLGIAAALTAIQLLPLPASMSELLNPTGAALRDDGAALLELSPWHTLSLDTSGSLRGLIFFVILLGFAMIALRVAALERGRYQIAASVAVLCGATAIVVGIHALFGTTQLYGIYEAEHAAPPLLGPLLNPNHLGCLMAVGTVVAIGLVAYRRQRAWLRVAWLVVVCTCGVITVATVSRGATLALVAGAVVTVGVLAGQWLSSGEAPRRRMKFLTSSLPIGIVAACTVVIVVYSGASNVERQLAKTSFQETQAPRSKYGAWKSSIKLIEEAPWSGIGRGAFESSFTRVHPTSGLATFSHLENGYLQAVVDWGVLGASLLGLGTVWLAVVAIRRWRDGPLAAGALGALAVVAMQSNVDFGIEMLGVAGPIVAIAAIVAYVPLREATTTTLVLSRALRLAHIGALGAGIALLMSSVTTTLDEDHEALGRDAIDHAEVREILERHPLDYLGFATAAQLMARTGDRRSIVLLNHALRLHPTHPGLHRMAARLLLREGHVQQATIEYAAALRSTAAPRKLIEEIVTQFPRELAADAIPTTLPNVDELVTVLEELGRADVATTWLVRILTMRPKTARACALLYELAMRHGKVEAATLAGKHCASFGPTPQVRRELARVLMGQRGYAEVIRLLADVETWPGRIDDKVTSWLVLCDAHAALGHWDDAKRCVRRLDVSSYVTPDRAVEVSRRLEQLEVDRRAAAPAATGSGSAR